MQRVTPACGSVLMPFENPERNLAQLVLLTDDTGAAMMESLPSIPLAAVAEYMLLAGRRRDPAMLTETRDAFVAKPCERMVEVVVSAMAPPAWQPG